MNPRWLLEDEELETLHAVARNPEALLAFDFDGTLAPIVDHPDNAAMRPATRELLRRLCAKRRVAVISGRAVTDLERLVGGLDVLLVGNHGAEGPLGIRQSTRDLVASWHSILVSRLSKYPEVRIENQGASLSLHYRAAPEAREAIVRAIRPLGAYMLPGKMVINVIPNGAPDKGDALTALARKLTATTILYVGDDITDEYAFMRMKPPSLAVAVGRKTDTGASHYLKSQLEIDRVLEALVAAL